MKKFTLEIFMENAAFDEDPASEISSALNNLKKAFEVAPELLVKDNGGRIRDSNGNTVGRWKVR